ncbi:MAG: division/cell wall cluster transcriptional repressor MraZ [Planctomycetota bacterium]
MRFISRYQQKVDAQHRVVVPSRFREVIGEAELRQGLILTPGFDRCLFLFPATAWEEMAGRLSGPRFMTERGRMLQRLFFSDAVEVLPDKLGRIVLPDRLRGYAELEDEALFAGVAHRIEIWSPARWEELTAEHADQLKALAEEVYQTPQGGDLG